MNQLCIEYGESCNFCDLNGFCKHIGCCPYDEYCEACEEYDECDRPEKEVL